MTTRIAINGFGRIGRKVFRLILDRADLDVVAVNDLAPAATLAHLLNHDSVHRLPPLEISVSADGFAVSREGGVESTRVLATPDPAALPWAELGIDLVIECSGRFTSRKAMAKHLDAGAGRVLLSAPAKDEIDATIVWGVNEGTLSPAHRLVSAASCTTNCLAPLVKVLDEAFGIDHGMMTTIHAYTGDQVLLDAPHTDLRRGRAAALNVVPTTTGAANAVALVYPPMAGKLDGIACRVPVAVGSLVDLTVVCCGDVSVESINQAVSAAAAGKMRGIIEYSTAPLVSQDIVGRSSSTVFDSLMTSTMGLRMAKVLAWYDNEWGYSCRCVDVAAAMAALTDVAGAS